MLSIFARLLLTGTALAPVGLTYAWVAFVQGDRTSGEAILAISSLLILACFILIWRAGKSLAASEFKPASLEAADQENTAFLLLYVMPLFTSQFQALNWAFWFPTVLIFAVITATGYSYHFNPLLGLVGWHFYKVQSVEGVTYVLITRKHLRTAATRLTVGQLTEYILLDLERR
jgi:hypothetical protein